MTFFYEPPGLLCLDDGDAWRSLVEEEFTTARWLGTAAVRGWDDWHPASLGTPCGCANGEGEEDHGELLVLQMRHYVAPIALLRQMGYGERLDDLRGKGELQILPAEAAERRPPFTAQGQRVRSLRRYIEGNPFFPGAKAEQYLEDWRRAYSVVMPGGDYVEVAMPLTAWRFAPKLCSANRLHVWLAKRLFPTSARPDPPLPGTDSVLFCHYLQHPYHKGRRALGYAGQDARTRAPTAADEQRWQTIDVQEWLEHFDRLRQPLAEDEQRA